MAEVEARLNAYGRFAPFAVVLTRNDAYELIAAADGDDARESDAVFAEVISGINERAADIKAAALVSAVQLGDDQVDAVRVLFDHEDGTTASVLMPYPEAHRRSQSG